MVKEKKKIGRYILSVFITLVFLYCIFFFVRTNSLGMALKKIELVFLLYIFAILNVLIEWKRLYSFIFNFRVWITLALCAFLILNKFNASSINQFDQYIQPGSGSEYVEPIFGHSRSIRSDEWLVTVPRIMSTEYAGLSKYNDVVRATKKTNLSASGLYLSYSALATPEMWGYYLFGLERGISFYWCFRIIIGFLIAYEFSLILTKRKKILSIFGAIALAASSYHMWWSTDAWFVPGMAAIVFAYYFLKQESLTNRIGWGVLLAIAGADFVAGLYPAWQVPAGYVFLGLLIWLIVSNWNSIKRYNKKDWLLLVLCIVFMISLIASYLWNFSEYMIDVMNTVYPGNRESYGGYSMNKLLGYLVMSFATLIQLANPSEMGCFFGVFPIGYILLCIIMVRKKGRDLLLWCLGVPTILLTFYCLFPLPAVVAKLTLLSFSTPERAVDIVGFALVAICLGTISELYDTKLVHPIVGCSVAVVSAAMAFVYAVPYITSFKRLVAFSGIALLTAIVWAMAISGRRCKVQTIANISLGGILIVSACWVNPIMYGLDAIKSKPLAKEISQIVEQEPEKKWIALDSLITGNFAIACGARTYNSTNYIPNYEFWKSLDPVGKYKEIYDRYAHIVIHLTDGDTTIELVQPDYIDLKLSYADLDKIDVGYIISYNQDQNLLYEWEEVYNEEGLCIYKKIG